MLHGWTFISPRSLSYAVRHIMNLLTRKGDPPPLFFYGAQSQTARYFATFMTYPFLPTPTAMIRFSSRRGWLFVLAGLLKDDVV